MAGIYIHIPFCRSRCTYCAFYSTTALGQRQRYVDAVCREMTARPLHAHRPAEAADDTVNTVYIGGGTPSQLSTGQLRQLLDAVCQNYKVAPGAEVTMEVNPDDVSTAMAGALERLPVNRVSMGVQTFDDRRLRLLNRRHSAGQVETAVGRLRQAGIGNISIDLMYGLPGQTMDDWEHDVSEALHLGVEHLSAYCLTVEEGTPLYAALHAPGDAGGGLLLPDEEEQRAMYERLTCRLTDAGYEHYELSNFARPGRRSRHNSSYWTDVAYIGLGAAAHSYIPPSKPAATTARGRQCGRRSWNCDDLERYMDGMERGKTVSTEEVLDDNAYYNDRVMLSLRTCEGLALDTLRQSDRDYMAPIARKYIEDGLLTVTDGHLRLTRRGLFVSDMIMSDLMRVE